MLKAYSIALKYLFLSGFIFLFTQNSFCQTIIKGNVKDSLGSPIPFAAVGLLNAKDSSLVKGALCNDSGAYVFENIKAGSYIIKVEVTGYVQQYSPVIKAESGSITVPDMQMKNSGNNLKGVRIVSDKPFIEHQAGKIIFNVAGSVVSSGKNALEVLNDLPGVTTDDNANITVHGKGSVLVLVDEKPVYMDLATYLKSIDASQIDKIEVITNPSAKYEASGKAVINIVLKKDKNLGLNGQFTTNYRQWLYAGFNENININYRTKKWNFFANTGLNLFHNYSPQTITETVTGANATQVTFNENSPLVTQGVTGNSTAGIDFMPDSRQTITFSVDGFSFLKTDKAMVNNTTVMHSQNTSVDSSLYNPSVTYYSKTDFVYSIDYKFKIDTNGNELSASLGYLPFRTLNVIQSPIYYFNSMGDIMHPQTLSTANEPSIVNVWHSQIDYTHVFNKKSKLDIGAEEQNANTDNDAAFYNVVSGVSVIDTTRSNHFNFKENVFAGYVNYYRKLSEKFDFQAGVRAEQTNDYGIQYVHDTSFTRNYFNLFPSAAVNWKVNDANSFSVSYSRRIDRPNYDDLNPFITQLSPYNYSGGNINLLPQFTDNYELDYNLGDLINATFGYINFSNVISQGTYQKGSGFAAYTTLVNISGYNPYYFVLTSTLRPAKWWTSINTFYTYHDHYFGTFNGNAINNSNFSYQFQSNNMFNFKHGWKAQISYWYHSSNLSGVEIVSPLSNLDIGIGKHFDNDKFIINLNVTDVLATQVYISNQNTPGLSIVQTRYEDSRKVRLSLTWKFGKSQYHRQEDSKLNLPLKGGKQ
jgi:iron complex outermembrane receptor protein